MQKRKAIQAESSVHRILQHCSEMDRSLREIRAALPAFDEAKLVLQNKHNSYRKRLRVQGIDTKHLAMPAFNGCCKKCRQAVLLSEAQITLWDRQLSWLCVPCLPNQERGEAKAALAAVRADVETGLHALCQRFDKMGDHEPRDGVSELIDVVRVLKASARKPDEEPAPSNGTGIRGPEKDAWSMALHTKVPEFPSDILGRCLVCHSTSQSERNGLAQLHRRLKDMHNRIFLTDLGALIKESVTRRNFLLAKQERSVILNIS